MMQVLKGYEKQYIQFIDRKTQLRDRVQDAWVAVDSLAADEKQWTSRMGTDKVAMDAYGKEVVALGEKMDLKFARLQNVVHSLIRSLNGKLDNLKKELQGAKDKAEMWSFFGAIFQVVKAVVSVAACSVMRRCADISRK